MGKGEFGDVNDVSSLSEHMDDGPWRTGVGLKYLNLVPQAFRQTFGQLAGLELILRHFR